MKEEFHGNRLGFKIATITLTLGSLFLCCFLTSCGGRESNTVFYHLEESAQAQSEILATTNENLFNAIVQSKEGEPYRKGAEETQAATKEFIEYVEDLKSTVNAQLPQGTNDDVLSKMRTSTSDIAEAFITLHAGDLENRITQINTLYQELAEHSPEVVSRLRLKIDEEAILAAGKNTWGEYYFDKHSAQSILPLLTALQQDVYQSAYTVFRHFSNAIQINEMGIKMDNFYPVFLPDKDFVTPGEKLEASVFLSPVATPRNEDIRIRVNGEPLVVEDGVGVYSANAYSPGTKAALVEIEWTNANTGEMISLEKAYMYEVGNRSIATSADKMNVFYIGVDNPISISAAGISSGELRVSVSGAGAKIKKSGASDYIVNVSTPGTCNLNVRAASLTATHLFRVKRIPDPVARLGQRASGAMGVGEFKAQGGVGAFLDNFDFDARCQIQGFRLTYITPNKPPVEVINAGARYTEASQKLIQMAQPGDIYLFEEVKTRCPGDAAGRKINSMVFKIK